LILIDYITQQKNIGWCEDPGWTNSGYTEVRCCTKQQPSLFREVNTGTFYLQWQLH